MNSEKAREFFSSYFEGSLDAGLSQTFERKLQTDAELQAEYRAFERTMSELSSLREVEAELPFDLHDKIQARLDLHVFEQKRSQKAPFALWFRTLGFAGLAALAIFGTIKAIGTDGDGGKQVADPMGLGSVGTQPPKTEPGVYQLKLNQINAQSKITVSDALTGTPKMDAFSVDPATPYIELKNTGNKAEFVKVEISGIKQPIYVAVPSKSADESAAEDATLRGAALRMAQKFGKPVVLVGADPVQTLPVAVGKSTDPVGAVKEAFGTDFMVDQRENGLIWVQQH
jgi:hypothetical protein